MQDRYAGDIGDFGKFALLRALCPGRRLGVGWYLTSGEGESNNDGRHLDYLRAPERFGHLDEPVFTALGTFVADFKRGKVKRSVASLEQLGLLPKSTVFHRGICPRPGGMRTQWATQLASAMKKAELVFLDPDNGLEGQTPSHKSVRLDELTALRKPTRALVVYHHGTRRKGGAAAEFAHQARRLEAAGFRRVRAVQLRPYSARFYFLLDGDWELETRLEQFQRTWGNEALLF